MKTPSKRLKKKETPPDVWVAHRKLRKKIASAKWYAKKKLVELQEQQLIRDKCEAAFQEKKKLPIWSEQQRLEWRCVTAHMFHGWPPRPHTSDISAATWCTWMDVTEAHQKQMTSILLNDQNGVVVPIIWSASKMHLFFRLCMNELSFWWKHRSDLLKMPEFTTERDQLRWFSSVMLDANCQFSFKGSASSSSTSWYVHASELTDGVLPVSCSVWGALCLQLWQSNRCASHWGAIVAHAINVKKQIVKSSDIVKMTEHSKHVAIRSEDAMLDIGADPHVQADTIHPISSPCIIRCPDLQCLFKELYEEERDIMCAAQQNLRYNETITHQSEESAWSDFNLSTIPSSLDSSDSLTHIGPDDSFE